jgi:phosphatidylglycerophosphatase A
VVGVLWFLLLVSVGSLTGFWIGLVAGLVLSVWTCGAAERWTGRKDPGSVVIDEIAAMPICFVPWLLLEQGRLGGMPPAMLFLGPQTWGMTLVLFALFRVFDIAKPWPIGASQSLPGGWGVTADDVLAAAAVAFLSLVAFW